MWRTKQTDKLNHDELAEVGTNNIISKTQRNKAQRSFQSVKAQRKMRNLIFLLSEAQRNFRNDLFDSVEAQRNSAIAERYFRTKLRWIYTVSVFRTFSSVFLSFCFSLKKYALFHSHFYKSISALSRLLCIDKNFVQKFCVWTIRAIFRNRAVPLYKKIFSENFCPVCDCLVNADMDT